MHTGAPPSWIYTCKAYALLVHARTRKRENLGELGIRDEPAFVPVEDTKEVVRDLVRARASGQAPE